MSYIRIVFLLAALLMLVLFVIRSSSGREGLVPGDFQLPSGIRVIRDISYKKVDGCDLKVDAYMPPDTGAPVPAVLFFHGGGWTKGDKGSLPKYYKGHILAGLVEKGYAVFSFGYRHIGPDGTHFPAPASDCRDAIRWMRKNGGEYNVDTSRLGLWGSSAGAHLALLVAYSPEDAFGGDPALAGYPSGVDYVVDNFGPAEMNKLMRTDASDFLLKLYKLWSKKKYKGRSELIRAFTGFDAETEKEKVSELFGRCSPTAYVNGQSVPTLILHGDKDKIVPLEQSVLLDDLLTRHGVDHRLIVVKGTGHGFRSIGEADLRKIVDSTLAFIGKHSGPRNDKV